MHDVRGVKLRTFPPVAGFRSRLLTATRAYSLLVFEHGSVI